MRGIELPKTSWPNAYYGFVQITGLLTFGPVGDVNLYRLQADVLKTDDSFNAAGNLRAQDAGGAQVQIGNVGAAGTAGVLFGLGAGADTNLYRMSANVLRTDDQLVVAGGASISNGLTVVTGGLVVQAGGISITGPVALNTGLTVTGNISASGTIAAGTNGSSLAGTTIGGTGLTVNNGLQVNASQVYLTPSNANQSATWRFTNNGGFGYIGLDNSGGTDFNNLVPYSMNIFAPATSTIELTPGATPGARVTVGPTGVVTLRHRIQFATNNPGATASVYRDGAGGLTIWGVTGSSSDLTFLNNLGQGVMNVPAGTNNAWFSGQITQTGSTNGPLLLTVSNGQVGSAAMAGVNILSTYSLLLGSASSGYSAPFTSKAFVQTNSPAGLMLQNNNNGPIQFYTGAGGALLAGQFVGDGSFSLYYAVGLGSTLSVAGAATFGSSVVVTGGLVAQAGLQVPQGGIGLMNSGGIVMPFGVILAGSGGTTAATYSFYNSPNTGLWWNAVDRVGISLAGLDYIQCVSTGSVQTRHLAPLLNNTYQLGAVGALWTAVYATNGVIQTSTRTAKHNIHRLNPAALLKLARQTDIHAFRYKSHPDVKPLTHVGFLADETHRLLTVDGQSASPQTTASVALGAVRGLDEELRAEITQLKERIAQLEQR